MVRNFLMIVSMENVLIQKYEKFSEISQKNNKIF